MTTISRYLMAIAFTASLAGCSGDEPLVEGEAAETGFSATSSSTDYVGPCVQNEYVCPGSPLYLSADYRGKNPDTGTITLPKKGRFMLGISCKGTGFTVIRVGADSALCTSLGKCTPAQLSGVTKADIDWVRANQPAEVPFYHECRAHGFGWYQVNAVPKGTYLLIAASGSAFGGLFEGHGTMDSYCFYGNGGAPQYPNCPH